MTDESTAVVADIAGRIAALKELPIDAIQRLPDNVSEEVSVQGATVTITTWHDLLTPDQHRVVVQAHRPALLMGRMYADGFALTATGIRALTFDELAPFT